MELINDIEQLRHEIESHAFTLLYIQAPDCGLCSVMLDKIEKVVAGFDQLRAMRAEIHVVPEIAGAFMVATAPTVLVFSHGKEVYRAGTFIDILELEKVLTTWSEYLNCQP